MATMQKLPASDLSSENTFGSCKVARNVPDQFPAGLRVLVVDGDTLCLKILEQMLRKCLYHVTTCSRATIALSLLRENKGGFDVVISDVDMPDMDGYKLLELVGLEMDLPVIMMCAAGRIRAVMKGITHGACDYLIKPIRIEELKNIWRHVIRKKQNESKEVEHSGSVEDSEQHRRVVDDNEYAFSINEGADGSWKVQKKRRDAKEDEDDGELDNDDPATSKKPRVVWSVELRQQFVSAVNQLGIDKAIPKRILELMNVPGLTRENVASHLQKYRLYLKRMGGIAQLQGGITSSFLWPEEPNGRLGLPGGFDAQALEASGQFHPQTQVALHAELLGRPKGSSVLPAMDQSVLEASLHGARGIPVEPWPPNYLGALVPSGNIGVLKTQNSTMPVQVLQPQQQQQSVLPESTYTTTVPRPSNGFKSGSNPMPINLNSGSINSQTTGYYGFQSGSNAVPINPNSGSINNQQSVLPGSTYAITVLRPSNGFKSGGNPMPINQNSGSINNQITGNYGFQSGSNAVPINQNSGSINNQTAGNYSALSSKSKRISLGAGQAPDGDFKNVGVLNGYSIQDFSVTPLVSSSSVHVGSSTGWQVQNSAVNMSPARLPGLMPNVFGTSGSCDTKTDMPPDLVQGHNLGFVGKRMSIPSQFATDDDIELPADNLSFRKVGAGSGDQVKQELRMEFTEDAKSGIPVLHRPQSELMSVLSKQTAQHGCGLSIQRDEILAGVVAEKQRRNAHESVVTHSSKSNRNNEPHDRIARLELRMTEMAEEQRVMKELVRRLLFAFSFCVVIIVLLFTG